MEDYPADGNHDCVSVMYEGEPDVMKRIETIVNDIRTQYGGEMEVLKNNVKQLEADKVDLLIDKARLEQRIKDADASQNEMSLRLNHIIGFINSASNAEGSKAVLPVRSYLIGENWGSYVAVVGDFQASGLVKYFEKEIDRRSIEIRNIPDDIGFDGLRSFDWETDDSLRNRKCVVVFIPGDDIETEFQVIDSKKPKEDNTISANETMIVQKAFEFSEIIEHFKNMNRDLVIITPGLRDTRNNFGSEKKGLIASAFIRFGEEIESLGSKNSHVIGVMNLAKLMVKERHHLLEKSDTKVLNEDGMLLVWKWVKDTLKVINEEDQEERKRRKRILAPEVRANQCLRCMGFGHRARECRTQLDPCWRCGSDSHVPESCKALIDQCEECGGTGHYKRVCPSIVTKRDIEEVSIKRSRNSRSQPMNSNWQNQNMNNDWNNYHAGNMHSNTNNNFSDIMKQMNASMNTFLGGRQPNQQNFAHDDKKWNEDKIISY